MRWVSLTIGLLSAILLFIIPMLVLAIRLVLNDTYEYGGVIINYALRDYLFVFTTLLFYSFLLVIFMKDLLKHTTQNVQKPQ